MGEVSILSSAILHSFFPIITILSYNGLGPVASLAWTTLFSFFFFLIVALMRKSWVNIFQTEIFLPLLGVTSIIGVAFYLLFFFGLKYTTAGNASIIATLEIFFSFLFFNVWRKESLDKKHMLGAGLMLASAIVILSPNFTNPHVGDFLILSAVFIAPLGNLFQKQLRSRINSEQILFFRTLIATPVLFILANYLGESLSVTSKELWFILLVNGIFLFGISKILWIESIYRLGVTKSISLSSLSPIFTLLFAFLILKNVPTATQLVAVPLY